MDKIFVENLQVNGKHGVMDHERELEQAFLIDIVAEFDASIGAATDQLFDTIDYSKMRAIAIEVVENNSVYLIEKLAVMIAERILEEDGRIESVSVTVKKPAVFPSGVPGVTIIRKKV